MPAQHSQAWYLYVPAPSHLDEVLVLLQGLVHFIICHAVAAQTPFAGVIHLGKNDKLGHVGHRGELLVQQSGEVHSFGSPGTVGQPEPRRRGLIRSMLRHPMESFISVRTEGAVRHGGGRSDTSAGQRVASVCQGAAEGPPSGSSVGWAGRGVRMGRERARR